MNHRKTATTIALVSCAVLAVGCTGKTNPPTSSTPMTSSATASESGSDVPRVSNPLPATVLDGSPCDTALTADQISTFLGQSTPAKATDSQLGPICQWSNAAGSGAGITVTYQTQSDKGIGLAYENVQPKAARWKPLDPVQDYPAVAYSDFDDKRHCVIVVGVSDQLAFSVALTLGDKAASQGKDSFDVGPDVASAVLTNLKARA